MRPQSLLFAKLSLIALFAAGACSGKNAKPSYAPSYNYSGGYSSQSTGSSYEAAAPAAAPAADGVYRSTGKGKYQPSTKGNWQTEAAPKERPGLGTSFGETRTSYVRQESFVRAGYEPFALVSLFYNDEEGVAAQVAYRGGEDPYPVYAYTPHGGISVSLQDQWGNILPGVQAGGDTYVIGQDGARYALVIQNFTGGRYEVVASVDGLDVIDGLPADLSKRGYLLAPYGRLVIDGFRTSDRTVAAFRFGSVDESYAALTSGDRNVGVIGVAFFAEYGSPWTSDELHKRQTADPFPGDSRYAKPPRYY